MSIYGQGWSRQGLTEGESLLLLRPLAEVGRGAHSHSLQTEALGKWTAPTLLGFGRLRRAGGQRPGSSSERHI